jgi:hypothetical protein
VLLRFLPHLSPEWLFLAPAVVFASGCALEKLALGLDRLLTVGDRFRRGGRDELDV